MIDVVAMQHKNAAEALVHSTKNNTHNWLGLTHVILDVLIIVVDFEGRTLIDLSKASQLLNRVQHSSTPLPTTLNAVVVLKHMNYL